MYWEALNSASAVLIDKIEQRDTTFAMGPDFKNRTLSGWLRHSVCHFEGDIHSFSHVLSIFILHNMQITIKLSFVK